MRRVLITGGAGFIGNRLSAELAAAGDSVCVLDDFSAGGTAATGASIITHRGNVANSVEVHDLFSKFRPQIVYHLAARHYIPACAADPDGTRTVNVGGTKVVCDACRTTSVEHLILASSAAVYAPTPAACSETSRLGPIEIYGETKLSAESLVHDYASDGHQATIVRLFNVYGPGDLIPHVIPSLTGQVVDGARTLALGALHPLRDYVHVGDVVRALTTLKEAPSSRSATYNVGTGVGTSVRDLVDLVSSIVGRKIAVHEEKGRLRATERLHLVADATKLRSDTGWSPEIDLERGLAELLQASNANGRPARL